MCNLRRGPHVTASRGQKWIAAYGAIKCIGTTTKNSKKFSVLVT